MDLSAPYLFTAVMIGALGMGLFIYGKKAQRPFPLVAGLCMCVYPMFIDSVWIMCAITAVLCAALYFLRQQ